MTLFLYNNSGRRLLHLQKGISKLYNKKSNYFTGKTEMTLKIQKMTQADHILQIF